MNELDKFLDYINAVPWYIRPFLPQIIQQSLNDLSYSRFNMLIAAIRCEEESLTANWFSGFEVFYNSAFYMACRWFYQRGLLCVDFVYHPRWSDIYQAYSMFNVGCSLHANPRIAEQLFHEMMRDENVAEWRSLLRTFTKYGFFNKTTGEENIHNLLSYPKREDIFSLFSQGVRCIEIISASERKTISALLAHPITQAFLEQTDKSECAQIFEMLHQSFGEAFYQRLYLVVMKHPWVGNLREALEWLQKNKVLNESNVNILLYNATPMDAAYLLARDQFKLTPTQKCSPFLEEEASSTSASPNKELCLAWGALSFFDEQSRGSPEKKEIPFIPGGIFSLS